MWTLESTLPNETLKGGAFEKWNASSGGHSIFYFLFFIFPVDPTESYGLLQNYIKLCQNQNSVFLKNQSLEPVFLFHLRVKPQLESFKKKIEPEPEVALKSKERTAQQ